MNQKYSTYPTIYSAHLPKLTIYSWNFKKRLQNMAMEQRSNKFYIFGALTEEPKVMRWSVSNGARHNWKCFLDYKKFEVFFFKFYMFLIHQNLPHLSETFYSGQKILKLWRQESLPFTPWDFSINDFGRAMSSVPIFSMFSV